MLQRVRRATLDELGKSPTGRYVAGEKFVHFCESARLWGVILWDRPEESDALELGRSLVLELAPPALPHASIVDASRLGGTDPRAFGALERYLDAYQEPLSRQVVCLALVRPSGIHGAVVAGIFEVVRRPYPVAVFDRTEQALSWIDGQASLGIDVSEIADELERLYVEVAGTPPYLGKLRALLEQNLRDLGIAEAAKSLGVSERTLQRRLAEAGTSFLDELGAARVRAAQTLLLESDAPLTVIALDVGCASLQHFSALFKSRTGESPRAWRDKHKA